MKNSREPDFPDSFDWGQFLPSLAIDCVIFGYSDDGLKILILGYKNTNYFSLPGGFIKKKETIDDAAKRIQEERTGLKDIYLNQFYAFGNLERSDPEPMKIIMENNGFSPSDDHWLLQRFVSLGYFALVNYKRVKPRPGFLSDSCRWYGIRELPELIFDHAQIVEKALKILRRDVYSKRIGKNLLFEMFTMGELQKLYESILGEKLHRTGFHRKMMRSGLLKRLGKKKTGGAHRSPYLYSFRSDKPKHTIN